VSEAQKRGFINTLQEFSIPLLSGVVMAMLWPTWIKHPTST
jgi:hypothetical protein